MEEVEETERAVLLDGQHVSKNEAFVSEDLSVGVDPILTGLVHYMCMHLWFGFVYLC